jgi:hypothetical protein
MLTASKITHIGIFIQDTLHISQHRLKELHLVDKVGHKVLALIKTAAVVTVEKVYTASVEAVAVVETTA